MAKITGILCQIITGDVSGAGTDGRVYLGLGGREFCMYCTHSPAKHSDLRICPPTGQIVRSASAVGSITGSPPTPPRRTARYVGLAPRGCRADRRDRRAVRAVKFAGRPKKGLLGSPYFTVFHPCFTTYIHSPLRSRGSRG